MNIAGLFKFFKKDDKIFYDLFVESAVICEQASEEFLTVLEKGFDESSLPQIRSFKHKSNKILKKTLKMLNKTNNISLEHEDVRNIASMLNRITKKIVKACINLKVYSIDKISEDVVSQAKILTLATKELTLITENFSSKKDINFLTDRNIKMKEFETRGDEIHYHALEQLFSGAYDALTVIKYRDIHKDTESALDLCNDVSDAVTNVVYKQK